MVVLGGEVVSYERGTPVRGEGGTGTTSIAIRADRAIRWTIPHL